jgi:hypothetical protein
MFMSRRHTYCSVNNTDVRVRGGGGSRYLAVNQNVKVASNVIMFTPSNEHKVNFESCLAGRTSVYVTYVEVLAG